MSPSEFQITYMYRNKQNIYTTYISLCIKKFRSRLRNGQFHTFREDDTYTYHNNYECYFCRNRNNDKRNDRIRY